MNEPQTTAVKADPVAILADDALFAAGVNGLVDTKATAETVAVSGQSFAKAVRVTLTEQGQDTNSTQITVKTSGAVEAGDGLLVSFWLRGKAASGKGPARVIAMFEKSSSPWTKSLTQTVTGPAEADGWKRVVLPFTALESYKPGEAMLSLRLATQVQTVEIGGLSLVDYGKNLGVEAFLATAAQQNPLGKVTVAVKQNEVRQTIVGFGGNFCAGRFGRSEMNDPVGAYNLEHLDVRHARVGLPLQFWQDGPGQPYKDSGPNHGVFLLMQEMTRRKIPMVVSIWDAPKWMFTNPDQESGRIIPRERWPDAIEAIAQWLVTARDKYKAEPAYISFNEADGGYQIKFTSAEIAAFIKRAAPRFQKSGLKIKWLVGDTSSGRPLVRYARPLLEDKELAPHLGPISFHSWDALSAAPEDYEAIAALGKEFGKPLWCLEMGHDAQLWRANPPAWATWDNALRLATAYGKTLKYGQASVLDYWEYQNDYPLVSEKGEPYPAFHVVAQMAGALKPGMRVVATSDGGDSPLLTVAAVGPRDGFSVLLINSSGAGEVTLTGLPAGKAALLTRNTAGERAVTLPTTYRVAADGSVIVPFPARSVSSLSTD